IDRVPLIVVRRKASLKRTVDDHRTAIGIGNPSGDSVGRAALNVEFDAPSIAMLGIRQWRGRLGVGYGSIGKQSGIQCGTREQIAILPVVKLDMEANAIVQSLFQCGFVMSCALRAKGRQGKERKELIQFRKLPILAPVELQMSSLEQLHRKAGIG